MTENCHLEEGLGPHLFEVGWGAFIYGHCGAVLQRLPLSQMTVGLHRCHFPEVLLRVGGLTVAPILSVEGLSVYRTVFTLFTLSCLNDWNLTLLYTQLAMTCVPHCKASQLLQSQCWLQLEAQHRWLTWSQLYHRRCCAQHRNPPKTCKA